MVWRGREQLVPVGSNAVTISAPAGHIASEAEPEQVTVTADSVVEMPPCALGVAPNHERLFLPRLPH
jgi:hypothetical protein